MSRLRYAVVLAFAVHGLAQAADTLRCGSTIVSRGDPAEEVLRKCGQPVSRSFVGYLEAPGYGGRYNQSPIEEWLYGPTNGMYQYLRFEGNRLNEIRSKRGD
ncbi:DUF2845 domain-containing protein [Pseudomonas sp. dw_358]|uniref:DUF2845 domain-containing protein n=1 Tax=Pseudomonas sp. dw_358 TaxID=2720083 RepID=UPI001BD5B472|nr:DUF2845 domain-containing protein [Pseudomonas sp. dw_358]